MLTLLTIISLMIRQLKTECIVTIQNFINRKMTSKKTLLFLLIFCLSFSAFGQAPKYSNEFLSIGVGGRPMGMSGAVAGSVNDATSVVWNPAGLTGIQGNVQVAAMHAELFAGISKFDYLTIAAHIDSSRTIGLSIIRFGTGSRRRHRSLARRDRR